MSIVSIPEFLDISGTIYYRVKISLPLRSISVEKRYSDFVELVKSLSGELGLSTSDFPYKLPPKSGPFGNKRKIAEQRQLRLTEFLLDIVKDRDLQNRVTVHRFLQLPKNFRFSRDLFESEDVKYNDEKFLIDDSDAAIEKDQWLTYFRVVRSSVSKLSQDKNLAAQVETREKIKKYIQPNVEKLTRSLSHLSNTGVIDKSEVTSRTTKLSQLQNDIEQTLSIHSRMEREPATNISLMGRVFGKPGAGVVREQESTAGLNNQQLFQQQQQIHQQQDQEIEQLRKIIARQRLMGQAINQEVEEQNEMLDRFSEEVDSSSDKLRNARTRAKKIA